LLATTDAAAADMATKYVNGTTGQFVAGNYRVGVPPLADWLGFAAHCRNTLAVPAAISDQAVTDIRAAIVARMRPNLYMQVTAGILPKKIAKLMNRAAENRDVASVSKTIAHGADAMEKLLTSGAGEAAKAAMNATNGLTRSQKNSNSMHGFLALVISYLYGNYIFYRCNTVAKNLVPFLSKTPLNRIQRELDVDNRPDQFAPATFNALKTNIENGVLARVALPDVQAFWVGGAHNGGPLGDWQNVWLPGVLDGTGDAFSVAQLAGRTINPEDHAKGKDITPGPERALRNPGGEEQMGVIPLEFRHIEGTPDPAGLRGFVQQMITFVRGVNS